MRHRRCSRPRWRPVSLNGATDDAHGGAQAIEESQVRRLKRTEGIMREITRILVFLVLVLVVPMRSVAARDQDPNLKNELQELLAKMDRAMVDGDTAALMAFYADDAVLLPNNAPKIAGKAEIRKKMEDNRKTGVTFGSFSGTVEQAWECGGMVYAVGSYALSANLPGVPRPVGDKGKTLTVFRRLANGKLEIVYDIWNTDVEMGK
jgi:ketosteroid isomerase-like protein